MIKTFDKKGGIKPELLLPDLSNIGSQVRIEPALSAFIFADMSFGNPFISSIRLKGLELRAGPTWSANLALAKAQILALQEN